MATEISRSPKVRCRYYIPAPALAVKNSRQIYTLKLVSKGAFLVLILLCICAKSFAQTNSPIETDSIISNMHIMRDDHSCDTSRMYTEIKKQQMDVIVCRLISYLKDSSICRIEIESNDFFKYKCDRFYFFGGKLIKANVLLVNSGGIVWDRHIYYNENKEVRQDGYGQYVMANIILSDAYKIRKETMENK